MDTTAGVRRLQSLWRQLDDIMVRSMAAYGVPMLRSALGIVFIWFGALKVIGRSPVADLLAETVYWADPNWFVPFLGLWEVIVGLGLLFRAALRLVLLLFWLQMAGTFLTLAIRPDLSFQSGNPLLLSTTGEFVIKNLVLIAAGIVIGSTVPRQRRESA